MEEIKTLWKDRRRRLGLPLSFTKYHLTEDRIFCEKGLLNLHEEEILLYRVRDLELKNIRKPKEVKELLYRQTETSKDARRMRTMEFVGNEHNCHHDGAASDDLDQ